MKRAALPAGSRAHGPRRMGSEPRSAASEFDGTLLAVKLPWRRSPPPEVPEKPDWQRRHRLQTERRRKELLHAPSVRLREGRVLQPPYADAELVTTSIGPTGEIVALWSQPSGRESLRSTTTQPGWAHFPDAVPPSPVEAMITIQTTAIDQRTTLRDLNLAHPMVQPLPDGQLLVVGARCSYTAESGAERNAIRFNEAGDAVATGTLGDGVQSVQTTPSGDVWVGYFDEGIFGNYGWGAPSGPEPIGAAGLVKFSGEFEITWRFQPEGPFNTMADCYALNVVGENAWVCYYTDFPIASISQDRVAYWQNSIAGARALVTAGESLALVGGYDGERDRVVIGQLGAEAFDAIATRRLVRADGSDLSPAARLVGRGPTLYAFDEMRWFELTLEELADRR